MATYNNLGLSPDEEDDLQVAPGPGFEQGSAEELDKGYTVTEGDDGSMTFEFPEEEKSESGLGFGDNIAESLDETELETIGKELIEQIEADDSGREEWKKAFEEGLDLLGINYEDRQQPFQGASGVVHPILHEAVIQFQSQAYKELLPAGGPVRTVTVGDETPEKQEQAERVKNYLNFLITEVMEEYDPDFDQMLYHVGFAGSAFKKVYYDEELERAVSPYILAKDLIVPYGARDLFTAERVTHVIPISENALKKLQVSGFYRDIELKPVDTKLDIVDEKQDKLEGIKKQGETEDFLLYECHCNLLIPGYEHPEKPGIKVPFIVTIEATTGTILSIRRNYAENDPKCRKKQYFVHYKFLPGTGFYGLGLVHLLGNIARASTSILRQLIDAGTLSNLPGGFKAKGMRVADEKKPIQPGEWRDVDAPGGDLSASLMPLPYKEPSATLFQLLGFLVEAAEKFIGTTDLGMGDSNQELPVGSVIALLERGSRVLSSVHKRMHYAQKLEIKLLTQVVADSMAEEYPYDVKGGSRSIKKSDFDGRIDVLPVSDPNIFSMTQRISLAQEQLKMAQAAPQLHNQYEAYRRMYVALQVPEIDDILPRPADPAPESPMAEHAKLLAINGTSPLKAFQDQDHDTHLALHVQFYQTPILQSLPPAQVALLQHIMEHVTFKAKQQIMQGVQQAAQMGDPNGYMIQQTIQQDEKWQNPGLQKLLAQAEARIMGEVMQQLMPPQQQPQDPLVALKAQELQIKQQDSQQKAQESQQKLQLENQKIQSNNAVAQARIESAEKIAAARNALTIEQMERDEKSAAVDRALSQRESDLERQARFAEGQMNRDHQANQAEVDRQHQMQQGAIDRHHDMQQTMVDQQHQSQEAEIARQHQANEAEVGRQYQSQEADKNRKAAAKKPPGGKK